MSRLRRPRATTIGRRSASAPLAASAAQAKPASSAAGTASGSRFVVHGRRNSTWVQPYSDARPTVAVSTPAAGAGTLALITLDNGEDHTKPNTFGPASLVELDHALGRALGVNDEGAQR